MCTGATPNIIAMSVGAIIELAVVRLESSARPPAETHSIPGYITERAFVLMRWCKLPAIKIAGTAASGNSDPSCPIATSFIPKESRYLSVCEESWNGRTRKHAHVHFLSQ